MKHEVSMKHKVSMKTLSLNWNKKLKEVFYPYPNDLGWSILTKIYKKVVFRLKFAPFLYIIPLAFLLGLLSYFIFGSLVVKIVSILQRIF